VKGLQNILEKPKSWEQMIEETHTGHCSKPEVAGNYFPCTMGADVTMKGPIIEARISFSLDNLLTMAFHLLKPGTFQSRGLET
jgi:hypothetical protein